MHSRDTGPRRPMLLLGAVGLLVLFLVGAATFVLSRGGDRDAASASRASEDDGPTTPIPERDEEAQTTTPPDCSPVTVWSAPEILSALESAAERATDDCFTFEVTEVETVRAATALRDGDVPDVWVPNSAALAQLALDGGLDMTIGDPVASSPVLFATTPETASLLMEAGIDAENSFTQLTTRFGQLITAGDMPFVLRMGDPRVDEAAMALLSGTRGQAGSWADENPESREALVRLAQSAVQGNTLSAVHADGRTVVPVTEQQLAQEGTGLQGVLLADAGVVRMPFLTADGKGSTDAVAALEDQLRGEEAATDLAALGLRAGRDGSAPDVPEIPDGLIVPASDPSPQDVTATAETWAAVAPESRILAVVDISGSMAAEVEGVTRIDLARTAVETAVSVIPEQTTLGLWYFATALDGPADYAEQAPLRALQDDLDDGRTQKDLLLAILDDLGTQTLAGDTGLHDTLWAAYQGMQAQQTDDSISSVLLLTDGVNDDSTGGLTEDQVVTLLAEARASGAAPVNVVLIGMGPDVDEQALRRLAEAAGGESLLLRDPGELPQVFVDVVANRAQ